MHARMRTLKDRLNIGTEESDCFLYFGIQLTTHIAWDGSLCRFMDQAAYCLTSFKTCKAKLWLRRTPKSESSGGERRPPSIFLATSSQKT